MKYIVILIVVIILVRIDVVLQLFDKTSQKYQNSQLPDVKTTEVTQTELVPMNNDLAMKVAPRRIFLSMMEDFRSAPDVAIKDRALETLRATPTMFGEKLDTELESTVFRWRGLIEQKNKLAQSFLLELMKSLKGENLEMVKRFLSYSIDADLPDFLYFYSKTSDTNCMLITYLGDNLPEEEKYNELSTRLNALNAYIASDKTEFKEYAQRCQMVLKITVDKLGVSTGPVDPTLTPASGTAP